MKSTLLIPFFLALALALSAQLSFPTYDQQPVWRMSASGALLPNFSFTLFSLQLGPDTVICGKSWNPVIHHDSLNIPTSQLGFVRQEGQKVFVRKTTDCPGKDHLMYDFSVEAGDKVICGFALGYSTLDSVSMQVFVVSYPEYQGVVRKTILLYYSNPFFPSNGNFITWIEGIGALVHPFHSLECLDNCELTYNFYCLETTEGLLYALPGGFCSAGTPGVRYVNVNVTGGINDGTSWANAYSSLQDAIAAAQPGDTIWVAQGTYYPTSGTDRTVSFNLPDGLVIYGGFNGTETTLNQRDFVANETILSGNIGVPGDSTDNSYHVVYTLGTDSTTVLNGFTITNGYAVHPSFQSPFNRGGGMYIDTDDTHLSANPTITNCTFISNTAKNGGGLYCNGENDGRASPVLHNCYFIKNMAILNGGAFYKEGKGVPGNPYLISDCLFERNKAGHSGGAVYLYEIHGEYAFANCSFLENTSQLNGGAINYESVTQGVRLELNDCYFKDNLGADGGAFCFLRTGLTPDTTEVYKFIVTNSFFENNGSKNNVGGALAIENTGNKCEINIDASLFQNNHCFNGGGALYILNDELCSTWLSVRNCQFIDNSALLLPGALGGIFYQGGFNSTMDLKAEIVNSIFDGNAGAVGFLGGKGAVDAVIINSTFYNNDDFPIVKTWDPEFNYVDFYNSLDISNSIFWEFTPIYRMFYNNSPNYTIHDYTIHHCLINAPDCIVNGVDGCGEGVLYELDPLFINAGNGDLHLSACSSLINAGDNVPIDTIGLLTDLDGNARILDGTVDMGAYERAAYSVEVASVQPESCEQGNDGAIVFNVNGDGPLTYFWSNGNETGGTTAGLNAGIYFFTVTDNSGCSDSIAVAIQKVADLGLFFTLQNASSFTVADGSISIDSIEGGTPPYNILWDNGNTSHTIENLPVGAYAVVITDANGCIFIKAFSISAPNAEFEAERKDFSMAVVPNLVGKGEAIKILIYTEVSDSYKLKMFDLNGQMIMNKSLNIFRGNYLQVLSNEEWATGLYLLQLTNSDGKMITCRLLVQ